MLEYHSLVGSDNITIYDSGQSNDNGTIRIGTQGTQTSCYIAGIYGSILEYSKSTNIICG